VKVEPLTGRKMSIFPSQKLSTPVPPPIALSRSLTMPSVRRELSLPAVDERAPSGQIGTVFQQLMNDQASERTSVVGEDANLLEIARLQRMLSAAEGERDEYADANGVMAETCAAAAGDCKRRAWFRRQRSLRRNSVLLRPSTASLCRRPN
jgi:hypothetical protein